MSSISLIAFVNRFGCCPDNETAADGKNYLGCCNSTEFGCCPDNIKAASGPDGEGTCLVRLDLYIYICIYSLYRFSNGLI